jgi:glycosyltransferase involved in cell wall biosynthesis
MHLVFVVNHAAFFVSHRLPIAVSALNRGWSVTLVTGRAGSNEMEAAAISSLNEVGVAHHQLPFGSSTVNPFRELWGILRMASLLRRLNPDIVHCASPKGVLYGGIAARVARAPSLVLAISGMGYAFTEGGDQGWLRRSVRLAITLLSRCSFGHCNKKVIVQNLDDEHWVRNSGLCAPEDVDLIPGSGVEEAYFREVPGVSREPLVVFPARLLRDKGILEFVEASRMLRDQAPGWRFVLAGAADYDSPNAVSSEEARRWVAEGVVDWGGYVSDMPALLARASIVCLPSYREGLPKALLEAAAAGCAVVTTDTIGCREAILPGVTGDLVPPKDARALANVLLGLMRDNQRRESYARAGRLLARQRFSLQAIVSKVFDLYDALTRRVGLSRSS